MGERKLQVQPYDTQQIIGKKGTRRHSDLQSGMRLSGHKLNQEGALLEKYFPWGHKM